MSPARRHEPAKPGDKFGDRHVVAVLPHDRTSNERVLVACDRGHMARGYVFNLRKQPRCPKCPRAKVCKHPGRFLVRVIWRKPGGTDPYLGPCWCTQCGDVVTSVPSPMFGKGIYWVSVLEGPRLEDGEFYSKGSTPDERMLGPELTRLLKR